MELKAIFDKYNMEGPDVGCLLSRLDRRRRTLEQTFLKSENQDDLERYYITDKNGTTRNKPYEVHFSAGLRIWDQNGRPLAEARAVLVAEALDSIDKWVKSRKGEPNVRDMRSVKVRQITNVASYDAGIKRFQEGRNAAVANMKAGQDEDLDVIFGGKFHTRLFNHVKNGDLEGVQTQFNVNSPSGPFRGFRITSGAGILADAMVKDYALCGETAWSMFLRKLREYGFREDVCNVGIRSDSRDFNHSIFIFYHEHFHPQGLHELQKVVMKVTRMHNGQKLN